MRSYDPAEIAHLQSRSGIRARLLVWIVARDRETGDPVPYGFWNGDDDQTFVIGAESRAYHGVGALLGMDDLVIETGLKVRRMSVWLATAHPTVIAAAMGYDLRLAPVQIHRVLTDPLSHQQIAPPHRIWKGTVDAAPRVHPAGGLSPGKITIAVASAALALTRPLPAKYSDEAMRQRGGDDRMFRYSDVSGKVPVYWGEERHRAAEASGGSGSPLANGFGGLGNDP